MPVAPGRYAPTVSTGPVATPRARAQGPDVSGLQRGLDTAAATAFEVADRWRDEEATAAAKEADAALSKTLRATLYDPQEGYLYRRGGAATEAYDATVESLETAQKEILDGLDPLARQKAEGAFRARMDRARVAVDRHAADQRLVRLDTAADARIAAAADNALAAWNDPETLARERAILRDEVADMAERNGWAPEVTAQVLKEKDSAALYNVALRMGQDDPEAAAAFVDKHRGAMTGAHLSAANAALSEAAKAARGRRVGAEAWQAGTDPGVATWRAISGAESSGDAGAVRTDGASTAGGLGGFTDATWLDWLDTYAPERAKGLTREEKLALKFDAELADEVGLAATRSNLRIAAAAGDPTAAGAYVVHFAGRGAGPKILKAAPDTPIAEILSPGAIKANESLGGHHPAKKPFADWTVGEFRAWAARKVGGDAMAAILDEPDPQVRAAALSEYQLRAAARQAQEQAALNAAVQRAFAHVEAGGGVDELPLADRLALGRENMSGLRTYADKLAGGAKPDTDWGLYAQLSTMAAERPEEFMAQSPMAWRNRLDDTEFKKFVDLQAKMAEDRGAAPKLESLATLRAHAKFYLEAASDFSEKKHAQLLGRLIQWNEGFAASAQAEGRDPAPNAAEIDAAARRLLAKVDVDPDGPNPADGRYYTIDDLDEVSLDRMLGTADGEIDPANVTIDGERIPVEDLRSYALAFAETYGRPPANADELVAFMLEDLIE